VCRAVDVPVTVDLGDALGRVDVPRDFVAALVDCGVVGVTIADGSAHVEAVRAWAARSGVRPFIEARVDRAARYHETVRRARACVCAGADGVVVPGLDAAGVVRLARDVSAAVGVDVGDGWAPTVHCLARAGVRRVSLGRGALRSALATLRDVAVEAIDRGSYDVMSRALAKRVGA
jgi:2-methylisocitrate lyase-like PEP mutase family enzyme